MDLTPDQLVQLQKALLEAFDYEDMRRMLRLELGVKIEQELDIRRGTKFIFLDLIEETNKGGWLEKFLTSAHKYRSGNDLFNRVLQTLDITILPYDPLAQSHSVAIADIQVNKTLEKYVNQRTSFQRFDQFIQKLRNIGSQICRIEYAEKEPHGTGWLVGPDLLLTAYHVIEGIHKQSSGYSPSDIVCRFDYTDATTGVQDLAGQICNLAESWLIDYSPYASSDLGQSGKVPTEDELDYALLRLNKTMGEESVSGNSARGWIPVPENPIVMVQSNDIMFIPQHPQGRPLELAFGDVLTYNSNATRLTYNTNTEQGSSGSPCFDINLTPFGLHHAAGPTEVLKYNQCVPLRQIIKRMKTNLDVPKFWISNT